jgi:hypothetical protein
VQLVKVERARVFLILPGVHRILHAVLVQSHLKGGGYLCEDGRECVMKRECDEEMESLVEKSLFASFFFVIFLVCFL